MSPKGSIRSVLKSDHSNTVHHTLHTYGDDPNDLNGSLIIPDKMNQTIELAAAKKPKKKVKFFEDHINNIKIEIDAEVEHDFAKANDLGISSIRYEDNTIEVQPAPNKI
jgi:hypothetical protein